MTTITSRPSQSTRKLPPKVLFECSFKSVGPRTYGAHVKEASTGNQFIVLTEAKPDAATGAMRETRVFVFSEDFEQFKTLLRDTFAFVRDHPVDPEVRAKQQKYWSDPKRLAGREHTPADRAREPSDRAHRASSTNRPSAARVSQPVTPPRVPASSDSTRAPFPARQPVTRR